MRVKIRTIIITTFFAVVGSLRHRVGTVHVKEDDTESKCSRRVRTLSTRVGKPYGYTEEALSMLPRSVGVSKLSDPYLQEKRFFGTHSIKKAVVMTGFVIMMFGSPTDLDVSSARHHGVGNTLVFSNSNNKEERENSDAPEGKYSNFVTNSTQ